MINKLFLLLALLLFIFSIASASDNITTHYRLYIPEEGSRDWLSKISNDIITMDSVIYLVSTDVGSTSTKVIQSRDAVTTVGGAVGRIRLISADGSSCYIQVYSPN